LHFRDCSDHYVLVEIMLEQSKIRVYNSKRRPLSHIKALKVILTGKTSEKHLHFNDRAHLYLFQIYMTFTLHNNLDGSDIATAK
jgi:hypothetical protein